VINRYELDNKTVNPFVGGSSPPRGAIHLKGLRSKPFFTPIKKPKNNNKVATMVAILLRLY